MGNADIRIDAADVPDYCRGAFGELRAWEHEVELLRGPDSAFVGPISDEVKFDRKGLNLKARDLTHHLERRVLPAFETNDDLAQTAAMYVEQAMERDPSPNLSVVWTPCGIVDERVITEGEQKYAADALRELAGDGIDYVMIGRTLHIGPSDPGAPVAVISLNHVGPEVGGSFDGLTLASEQIVVGSAPTGSDKPVIGVAGGVGPRIGLVQLVSRETEVRTTTGAAASAAARLADAVYAPLQMTLPLLADAPVEFADLTPGNVLMVDMLVGLVEVRLPLQIVSIACSFGPGRETITPTVVGAYAATA